MKIAVAGLGYVGMANAVLLAQHNSVVAIDIDAERSIWSTTGIPPSLIPS
ncbi:UDP-glucose dehydrogenase [Cutibacterium acnes JCM 18920]|nr:UDP-glucose dehydrogenase [Cutibacterium acnes JCM 18920]